MSSKLEERGNDQNTVTEMDQLGIQIKLKGDVIGNTMYTQRFVLKTLLKFRDLEWTEQLEDDLCFLWDSTVEKDVCNYLMDINFPSIACSVILKYNTSEYGRLIEILVGTIANIITAKCEKQLHAAQVDVILSLLVSADSLILIQVLRFIISFSDTAGDLEFLTGDSGEDIEKLIKFILTSSNNCELIQKTIEALAKITDNSKSKLFFENKLLTAAIVACIRSVTEDEETDFELFTSLQRTTMKHLIKYVLNFCVYINEEGYALRSAICSERYIEILTKLCEWYSIQENLLPITDELKFYFEASNYIFSTLKVDFNEDLLKSLLLILKILIDNECEDIKEFIEMLCYFIGRGNPEQVKVIFRMILCIADIEKICKYLEKQNLIFNFDFRIDTLQEIYKVV